jgi:hypothetical protein
MIYFFSSKTYFTCLVLALISQVLLSQEDVVIYAKAEPNRLFTMPASSDYFTAHFENCIYRIRPNGIVTKYYLNKPDSVSFKLNLSDKMGIERADVYHIGKSLLIAFGEDDGESGSSKVMKFNLETLKNEWTFSGLSFNLSRIMIHKNCIYVASNGIIAKLDFDTGKVLFRSNWLYDSAKNSFNSFSDIVIKQDTVYFISKNSRSNRIDEVVFNDLTNTIISIDK